MPFLSISVPLPKSMFVSKVETGPIGNRNNRALSLPYMRFDQRDAILAPGERSLRISITSANDSRLRTQGNLTTQEDQETERLSIVYRQGLKSGAEASVEVPVLDRGGGFMDNLITWWHKNILHWQDPFRESEPTGRCVVQVPGASYGSASGLGDVSFSLKKPLGGHLWAEGGAKLPTGNAGGLLGSGGIDGGIALKGAWNLSRKWSFHAMVGEVAQSAGVALPGTRPLVHQEGMAMIWQPDSRDLWSAQWLGEASATVTGVAGSDATLRQLTFGYRRYLGSSQNLELYFCEDRDVFNGHWPEAANIAPDFSVGIGWTRKF